MLNTRFCLVLLASVFGADIASSDVSGTMRVKDADTIEIGGTSIRLHAIDAPEIKQRCGGSGQPVWACGAWSKAQAVALYDGKFAQCEQLDKDRYGRVVARCFVDGQDMAQDLVQNGLAFAYRKYGWDYDLDEKAAAVAGRGLHSTEVTVPATYRAQGRDARAKWSLVASPKGCPIKGNISKTGERIYHLPGQNWYNVTMIRADKGERWFCSQSEARIAGWRAAKK
ncbi:thermonuclease family protein [uncultured Pelagimonas sp.]|uniref:thermonuclease family protein n=1 Tax=uncultured Pelagimonas sp. TaxID=1618102 RepID=UPI00262FE754|nr:thermonuclease family protein [uncultured Pelagimonas sp.]